MGAKITNNLTALYFFGIALAIAKKICLASYLVSLFFERNQFLEPTLNKQVNYVYSTKADLLNVALFGITAKQWRDINPKKEENIRDDAILEQLVVLSNLESINAVLIHQNLEQSIRLQQLN